MKEYDQLTDKYTQYACSEFSLMNLFLYDYGVYVKKDLTIKFLTFLEKVGARFKLEGAIANVVYPIAINKINKLLDLKLKIGKSTLEAPLSPTHGYILGYKKANMSYMKTVTDGVVTKADIDIVSKTKSNGHFHFWKRGVVVESLKGFRYKLPATLLRYAYKKGLYYPTIRYIYGEEKLQNELIKIVKFRRMQKLDNPYVDYSEVKKIKEQIQYKNKN